MADERIRLPSSGGGLLSYYEEYHSRFAFKPGYVLLFIALVIVAEVLLYFL